MVAFKHVDKQHMLCIRNTVTNCDNIIFPE